MIKRMDKIILISLSLSLFNASNYKLLSGHSKFSLPCFLKKIFLLEKFQGRTVCGQITEWCHVFVCSWGHYTLSFWHMTLLTQSLPLFSFYFSFFIFSYFHRIVVFLCPKATHFVWVFSDLHLQTYSRYCANCPIWCCIHVHFWMGE